MDGFFAFMALFVSAAILVAPVLAIIALVRSQRLWRQALQSERRLGEIEVKLGALVRRIEALGKEPRPGEAAEAPAPAAERPAEPAPAPAAAPPTAPPAEPTPPPAAAAPPPRPEPAPPPAAPLEPPPHTAAPPTAPPRATRPPVPPPPRAVQIDWERWIGIRGAAVVGAIALALAGLLLFKYSIEHGLITPAMRVALGTLAGVGCLVGSERLHPRGYRYAADGLAGAGVVILYAAFWAAHVRYDLVGMFVAFGLMALVTVACGLLAVRRSSLVVAVLGLIGGFATPLLLSSGVDRPIGLFGYVLLLDLGLLWIGYKRRWPSLGVLSLLGTVLLQGLWIGTHMGPGRVFLGLAILAVFGALYVFWSSLTGDRELSAAWRWNRIGAIFFPFAFAVYFAGRVELGPHLYPVALLLALLCAAAGWIARQQRSYGVGVGAAAASIAVVGVWLLQHGLTDALAWETVAVTVGLAAIFHVFVELEPKPAGQDGPALAAMLAVGGFFVLLVLAASAARVTALPWIVAWAAFADLLYRQAKFPERSALQLGGALVLGLGLTALHLSPQPVLPSPALFLGLLVVASLALHGMALARSRSPLAGFADQAAAALPVLLLIGMTPAGFSSTLGPLPALGVMLALGLLALLAATRIGGGGWYAAAAAATLLAHVAWKAVRPGLAENADESLIALVVQALAVAIFTLWPLPAAKRFSRDRLAWWAAALAGPAWFLSMRDLFGWCFGDAFVGVLPVALGALALVAANRARTALAEVAPLRHSAIVWLAAVALCFLAVAIPLQLEKEWITIGWALEGLAVLALWKRLDHPGLKYFGLALVGAATLRLVANPALLGYYPRSEIRIVNWLLYTYLVPAAAMLAGAWLLRPLEAARARKWEAGFYTKRHPIGAIGSGFAAIVVVFVWINLTIADWFATGPILTLSFGDRPAQRLSVSIAWALYALLLLGLGMARDSLGLRWLSLSFLFVTIGKVFLYDLGALKDLYRVGSLVGLAVSLIVVSLLYQRFVFRKTRAEGS